ncbi:MAG: SUMF1/EgtB/PvdO family nonheme iron enzyme, partial [Anaerolineales bacterium]|nr:SUMF1/EgtB/PvdO family nonheme iron enzyme [Anaerolineales bacterium]
MRLARLLPLLLTLLLTSCLPQQANPPPPNPILTCFSEGLQKCLPEIWQAYGWNGVLVLVLCALLLWFFSPSRKILDERLEEWWRSLPLLRGKRPSPPEIERLEEDYLNRTLSELRPEDPAAKLDAYLHTLRERETPLKPSEEPLYVPLEGGLAPEELSPTLGLHLGGPAQAPRSWWARLFDRLRPAPFNPEQLFREQRTFENLEEALTATDPNTGQPYPVLALLGEPGAGKSTLMRRFARRQVERRLADPAERLPLFVSLGAHRQGTPLTFLREAWKHTVGFDGLDEALAQGRVWLFADGLNEMPRAGYDLRLAQWRAFLHGEEFSGRGNRALVACRVADYGEGIGAPRLVIHKMDDERIRAFLQKRAPAHTRTLWQQLEADRDHGRGDLYALAQTPFWLVMLARLTGSEGLPRNRAALLETFISRWLDYEATRPGGRMLDDACRQAFWEGLTRLARRGLERSQNYAFPRAEAERILTAAQTRLRAADLLTLGRDCTLLDLTPHSVRFQHQLLQEFFAARDLARRFAAGEDLRRLWQIPWRRWKFVRSRWDPLPPPPRTGWEEALILSAGLLDPARAEALVRAIQRQNPPLAARCALEAGLRLPEETLNDLRGRLLSDLRNPRQRTAARLEAGRALARLGDPRLLERRRTLPAPEGKETACIEPDWVDIPAGEFQMGTTPEQARAIRRAFGYDPQDEMPAHRVRLGAYRIARWPVTVAEYRLFLEAGGYENDAYWQ